MVIGVVSQIINIVMDFLLIVVFGFGIGVAALASGILTIILLQTLKLKSHKDINKVSNSEN